LLNRSFFTPEEFWLLLRSCLPRLREFQLPARPGMRFNMSFSIKPASQASNCCLLVTERPGNALDHSRFTDHSTITNYIPRLVMAEVMGRC